MARFAIVVQDEQKAHAFEVRRYAEAFERAGAEKTRASRLANERVGKARAKGTVHTEMDVECPDGLSNCRNCGDPTHLESCKAKGHCPHCGIAHGIAPDSVLAAHGFILEAR